MIHGGVVVESVISYFDKFGPLILEILFGFLVITSTLLLWLWFSNRKKYHNLKHAIPANVVQSYLDSIIQNSSALKSSLFRGGGAEITGVPSVMPSRQMSGGENIVISGGSSEASLEELNQKNALISSLEAQLSAAKNAQKALEAQIKNLNAEIAGKNARIKELEDLLAQAQANQGSGASSGPVDETALQSELNSISKERDELKDRLKEFEIISDDLADLKRLKQENEQLKRSLSEKEGRPSSSSSDEESPISADRVQDIFSDVNQQLSSTNSDISAFEDFVGGDSSEEKKSIEGGHEASDEASATESFGSDSEEEFSATEEFGSESGDEDSQSNNSEENENSQEMSNDESAIAGSSSEDGAQENEAFVASSENSSDTNEGEENVDKNKSDKTSEDLLSEFEKMLG